MKLHPEELELARSYCKVAPSEGLTREQVKLVMNRGRELFHWFKRHQTLHFLISSGVLVFLFGSDYWLLVKLPHILLRGADPPATLTVGFAALLIGGLHSWLMYSLSVFSMHEGASHGMVFPHDDPLSRLLNKVASNLCRVAAAEPQYYSVNHMSHHSKFGTEEDGEFLNFVQPRRFWLTLLPFAAVINYSDFVAHRPLRYTRSRVLSAVSALSYQGAYGYFMAQSFGVSFAILVLGLVGPHFGFYVDRLRQYTEHNLMPLENKDGSRSFGLGFWGMLLGGGPWGSPCHWEHHLVASLPWYQQLILHRDLRRILTPNQRKQYLIEPIVGFPRLLLRLWSTSSLYQRGAAEGLSPAAVVGGGGGGVSRGQGPITG